MPKRKSFRMAWLPALAAACLVSLSVQAPAMAADACKGTFEQELSKLGVSQSDIKDMRIASITSAAAGAGSPYVVGHEAWINLKSCKGNLVLRTSPGCNYLGAYTTRQCQLPGVPQY